MRRARRRRSSRQASRRHAAGHVEDAAGAEVAGASWRRVALGAGALLAAAVVAWLAFQGGVPSLTPPVPPADRAAYVPNDACLECHAEQAKRWAPSHHSKAMAPATEATVLGDFGGAEFARDGVVSRFFRRDGKFVVHTDGPDGALADFEVAYAFGVDPLQQYLLAQPGGRFQALTIAWDVAARRWFHLYPDEKTPPGDVLHWTGRYQGWNAMCASCHSTELKKGYDPGADHYATTWSEINVSCQSC